MLKLMRLSAINSPIICLHLTHSLLFAQALSMRVCVMSFAHFLCASYNKSASLLHSLLTNAFSKTLTFAISSTFASSNTLSHSFCTLNASKIVKKINERIRELIAHFLFVQRRNDLQSILLMIAVDASLQCVDIKNVIFNRMIQHYHLNHSASVKIA